MSAWLTIINSRTRALFKSKFSPLWFKELSQDGERDKLRKKKLIESYHREIISSYKREGFFLLANDISIEKSEPFKTFNKPEP